MQENNKQFDFSKIAFLLAIGLCSGLFGAWGFLYLTNLYTNTNNLVSMQYGQRLGPDSQVIIRDAKKVVVEQDERIADTISASQSYLVGFFKKETSGTYDLSTNIGQGLLISSDGWVLVTSADDKNLNWQKDLVAINLDKKIFKIIETKKDLSTGYQFVRLSDAQGLPVARLSSSRSLKNGQFLVASSWNGQDDVFNLAQLDSIKGVRYSDKSQKTLVVNHRLHEGQAIIFDLSNQVVGLSDAESKISTVDNLLPIVNSLLANEVMSRPSLGVYYKNLANRVGLKPEKGAVITKNDKLIAVVKNSAADQVGLKEGDVILEIDGKEINVNNDLAEIISEYKSKDKIYVKFLRGVDTKTIEVKLNPLIQ